MKRIALKIWNYFKNSWEGDDGKFSYKRFAQYIFMALMVIMIMTAKIDSQYGFYAFLIVAILFALTATIITVSQLILMVKYYKSTGTFDYSQGFTSEEKVENINEKVTEITNATSDRSERLSE